MGTPLRNENLSIKDELFESPFEFTFPQAVWLLEKIYGDKEPVGRVPESSLEAARFSSNISLSTPPSDLYTLRHSTDGRAPVNLTLNFLGIAGQAGPLPNVYSETILDRVREKDYAFRDFLDLFNHRLASIHFRIQVKFNLTLEQAEPDHSQVAQMLTYLGGLELCGEESKHASVRSYLKYAGLIWQKPHSASALRAFLKDYFGVPIEVEQFIGHWFPLEETQHTIIGDPGKHNVLGRGASLGRKVWIQGEKIRLSLGPVGFGTFTDLLPTGSFNAALSEMARHYMGRENKFDLALKLKPDEVPQARLDGKSALGWTSWINADGKPVESDPVVVKAVDPLASASHY